MNISNIPSPIPSLRQVLTMNNLLQAALSGHGGWPRLPGCAGIYVVYWTLDEPPLFNPVAGKATHAKVKSHACLKAKWERINKERSSDIIYIGKGDNLCRRIKELARFGAGKSRNHHGGECMWQIAKIDSAANVLLQACPPREQKQFEDYLLAEFLRQHGELPLANWHGPWRNGGLGHDHTSH